MISKKDADDAGIALSMSYQRVPSGCERDSESNPRSIPYKQKMSKERRLIVGGGIIVLLCGFFASSFHCSENDFETFHATPDYAKTASFSGPYFSTVLLKLIGGKPKPDFQPFAFEAVFGDNMVLQHGSKSAVYGYLGPTCKGVQVDVYKPNKHGHLELVFSTNKTMINATQQPFGEGWGVRPCSKKDCPGKYDMNPFNPWNEPLPTWKVLLPQQRPGGNYTIRASCLKKGETDTGKRNTRTTSHNNAENPLTITNVTFGDVWYCTGQSNMWLPVFYTFHRNETAKNIMYKDKYHNIRIMAGRSQHKPHGDNKWMEPGYGAVGGTNPWMTARQAIDDTNVQNSPLFQFGAACWYFGQKLVDEGIDFPIGLTNTAIGGQRIQEFMDNTTIDNCQNRTGSGQEDPALWWDAQLLATQVLPFADMTIKGWVWYQGENNMHDVKGNSEANVGYGCEMKALIQGWRRLWSQTPLTTDPEAPFGLVTLASSGDEGGPDMGTMRHAQTANFGVLPRKGELPNTFIAQAYDLDDEWGPDAGPCLDNKCCKEKKDYDPKKCDDMWLMKICNARPNGACAASMDTPQFMGGIHPRSKKYVGDRLGLAAYNLVYGGKGAYTGPTLQNCTVTNSSVLEIQFDKVLLRGDELAKPKIPPPTILPGRWKRRAGGSQLYVQTDESHFCMEDHLIYDGAGTKNTRYYCPSWAGGTKKQQTNPVSKPYGDGWTQLNFTKHNEYTIHVDLSPLKGKLPTAVRYAWGIINCCDFTDPTLYVTHNCIAQCPIQSAKSGLPANPFQARIVDGKCQCIGPQQC